MSYVKVKKSKNLIVIKFKSKSFLQQQVRSMVGCLKVLGEKKWNIKKFTNSRYKDIKLNENAPPKVSDQIYTALIKNFNNAENLDGKNLMIFENNLSFEFNNFSQKNFNKIYLIINKNKNIWLAINQDIISSIVTPIYLNNCANANEQTTWIFFSFSFLSNLNSPHFIIIDEIIDTSTQNKLYP